VSDIESRLDAQRKQLDDLLRRFTDEHPDVVSARRTIAQLEGSLKRLREEAARSGRDERVGAAATSPVYQRIRVSLAEAEARVASLRAQLGTQQAQLNAARAVASRVPQVEAEFAQLNRDYDVIRKNYEQMVARRESATLGLKLDESSQLAEFRLIEPPRVSRSPVFPSKIHLALIGTLASLAIAVLAALTTDQIRPTLDSTADLQRLSGRPVLGSVSILLTPQRLRDRHAAAARFAIAAAMLLTLQSGWLLWLALRAPAH
jgi:polysaccharide chain length determinant protein (PEP-CTERM system associated)